MSVQSISQDTQVSFLQRVVQVDGLTCGLSGLALALAAQPVAAFLGLASSVAILILGVGLLVYGAGLFFKATRGVVDRQFGQTVAWLNVAWVVASAVILFTPWLPLTTGGWWAVAIQADVVAILAALQFYGVRRLS